MRAVFPGNGLVADIESLVNKYPSIREDLRYLANLLRVSRVPSQRSVEFLPDLVFRTDVHVQALEGAEAESRCSLIYEVDGNDCYLLLLYDNDVHVLGDMIRRIEERR